MVIFASRLKLESYIEIENLFMEAPERSLGGVVTGERGSDLCAVSMVGVKKFKLIAFV